MHEFGLGADKDFKTAFYYYRKAATLDHVQALVKCGDFIYGGKGFTFNSGGKVTIKMKDKVEAFKCYKRASALGSSQAMNSMALMLEAGFDGVSSNPEQVIELYK